jgi:formamidopyrimidine-DNA glycosylase
LSLLPHVRGRVVRAAEVRRRDMVTVLGPRGGEGPLPRTGKSHLLVGWRVEAVERHGKQLALIGAKGKASRALVGHLGMTGQFFCLGPGDHLPDPSHVHVVWRLDSGARLVLRDPRRFGGVWALASREALEKRWSALGPDARTITVEQLAPRLARTRRSIKSALLDQEVLAGVGNIYADESLFLAGVSPSSTARDLSPRQVARLVESIRSVLAKAIAAGGSSVSDYVDGDGRPGSFQLSHAVYARGGLPCLTCGATLLSSLISNRTTVWCPSCQKSP